MSVLVEENVWKKNNNPPHRQFWKMNAENTSILPGQSPPEMASKATQYRIDRERILSQLSEGHLH